MGVRATVEEQRIIAQAAALEHRSVSSFVLRAALAAARESSTKPRKSLEEIRAIVTSARQAFRRPIPRAETFWMNFSRSAAPKPRVSERVLDASVFLALLKGERVSDSILEAVEGAVMSAVNVAEVYTKASDLGLIASRNSPPVTLA